MNYFTVDGCLSGTGIRDSVSGGFVELNTINIPEGLRIKISKWLKDYENAHYFQYQDMRENDRLDQQGLEICRELSEVIPTAKIEYYSSFRMSKINDL